MVVHGEMIVLVMVIVIVIVMVMVVVNLVVYMHLSSASVCLCLSVYLSISIYLSILSKVRNIDKEAHYIFTPKKQEVNIQNDVQFRSRCIGIIHLKEHK